MPQSIEVRPTCLKVDAGETHNLEAAALRKNNLRIVEDPSIEARRRCQVEIGLFCAIRISIVLRSTGMRYMMEQDGYITSIVLFSREVLKGSRRSFDTVSVHADSRRRGVARRLLSCIVGSLYDRCEETRPLKAKWTIRLPIVSIELSALFTFARPVR